MEYIKSEKIEQAFLQSYRNYLTGHLSKPQPQLPYIDDDIEIGISDYVEFTVDAAHVHPIATEHVFILSGSVKAILFDGDDTEYQFNQGDFFMIRPGIGHITKNAPGTRVLFIKSPGINDKEIIDINEKIKKWTVAWS